MIDVTDTNSPMFYASLEARLGDVVRDSRHAAAWQAPVFLVWAASLGLGLSHVPNLLINVLPTLPAVVTVAAVGASLLLTAYHLLLDSRARRRELKARVLLLDGELLRARIAAMRVALV